MSSSVLFLHPAEDGVYRWQRGRRDADPEEGTLQEATEIPALLANGETPEIVLMAPARETSLYRVPFNPDERKHLLQTVPYLLEEQLASNIDKLHFALGAIDQEHVVVAILRRNWLAQHLEELQEAGVQPGFCIPEQQLLPTAPGGWSCHLCNDWLTVHTAQGRGLSCNREIITPALTLLAEDEFPASIAWYGTRAELTGFKEALAESLRDIPVAEQAEQPPLPSSAELKTLLNLLQGEFRKKLSWTALLQEWGAAAGLLLGIALAYTAALGAEYRELRQEDRRLQQATAAISYSAYPEAPPREIATLSDRLAQEQAQLQDLERLQKSNFVRMMRMAGDALHAVPGTRLQSLRYNDRERKLLMEFETRQFSNIQKVRDRLQTLGVESRLLNSNERKGQFRVRLEFSWSGNRKAESKSS